jgi:hypothetical protein
MSGQPRSVIYQNAVKRPRSPHSVCNQAIQRISRSKGGARNCIIASNVAIQDQPSLQPSIFPTLSNLVVY